MVKIHKMFTDRTHQKWDLFLRQRSLSCEPTGKETGVVYYVASQIHSHTSILPSPCNKVVSFISTT